MEEVFQTSAVARTPTPLHTCTSPAWVNWRQLLIGLIILVLGTLFYYFFRPPGRTYFLTLLGPLPNMMVMLPPPLLTVSYSLPTFIHTCAFTVMTAALVARRRKGYLLVSLIWLTVDVLFELAQGLKGMIAPIPADWCAGVLLWENTRDHLLYGRLDNHDLVSIALGAVAAYIILVKTGEETRSAS